MQECNDAWVQDHSLQDRHYHWSLDDAQLVFPSDSDEVVADICVVGSVSVSEGTFLWAWANEVIPPHARRGLERVREFGETNALELLTKPEWPGGQPEGLEMAAVAARILDAEGVWVAATGDVMLYFVLSDLRKGPQR